MQTENGWDKEQIVALLETNDKAVARALIRIYERQTAAEQATQNVRENNNRGFNKADAPALTSIAQRLLRFGSLTPKQVQYVRRRITKYWRQLLEIAATHPKHGTALPKPEPRRLRLRAHTAEHHAT